MPRKKSFDPTTVLAQAMTLFWQKGFEATSIRDLEIHLGLGRASLYGTFGSKKKLFLECLEKYRSDVALPLLRHLDDANGLTGIHRFFAALTNVPRAVRRRGCFIVNTLVASQPAGPEVERIVREHLQYAEERLFHAVKNGQAQGTIAAHVKARGAACMLLTLVHGIFSLNRNASGIELSKAAIDSALAGLASG